VRVDDPVWVLVPPLPFAAGVGDGDGAGGVALEDEDTGVATPERDVIGEVPRAGVLVGGAVEEALAFVLDDELALHPASASNPIATSDERPMAHLSSFTRANPSPPPRKCVKAR
jgi:hypothetical protein